MQNPHLYGVIMAGGSGTRFWQASRQSRPKQFLPISGSRPMIGETRARLEGLVPMETPMITSMPSSTANTMNARRHVRIGQR